METKQPTTAKSQADKRKDGKMPAQGEMWVGG